MFLKMLTKKLPKREWTRLDKAAGIATKGLVKFSRASTTPSPEFCIPTSIDIVLATFKFLNTIQLIEKPIIKPERWSKTNETKSLNPDSNITSFPCPTILPTIRHINNTAKGGAKCKTLETYFDKYLFKIIPIEIGIKTTLRVL